MSNLKLPRFHREDRLAAAVARSPRLTALLDADELKPLVEAHDRAEVLAAEARKLAVTLPDPVDDARAAVAKGEALDAAALIARVTEVAAAKAARAAAVSIAETLPRGFRDDLARFIEDSADALYEGLDADLNAVLDRAEVVLRALGSATTAEQALDADLGGEYREFRQLAQEHAEIREAHRALLFASPGAVPNRHSPTLLNAFFAGAASVAEKPTGVDVYPTDGSVWKTPKADADLLDTDSREAFEYIVHNRATLRPRVGNGESTPSVPLDGGAVFAPRPLSARDRWMLNEAANARANDIAEAREALI